MPLPICDSVMPCEASGLSPRMNLLRLPGRLLLDFIQYLGQLAGLVAEGVDQDRDSGSEVGAGLVGELAAECYGVGEFPDGVEGVWCFHGIR